MLVLLECENTLAEIFVMVIPIVFEHAPAEIVRSPVLFLMVPDKNN
jgi:hypothetical protein